MFPSIDNENGIKAVYNILEKREEKKPSTDCIIEICLKNNNSAFAREHLLQTMVLLQERQTHAHMLTLQLNLLTMLFLMK